jgi:hypothetical protein
LLLAPTPGANLPAPVSDWATAGTPSSRSNADARALEIPAAADEAKAPLACPGAGTDPAAHTLNPLTGISLPEQADDWGIITVAQPKIWQFERVSALLDGLLRDVEGVSLADLTQLDPNAQNAAAVKFVQSALEVGVQYDQAAAVTNSINRGNYQLQSGAMQKRFEADNAYVDLLVQQRNAQTGQLLSAQNTVNTLQPLADAGTATPAQQTQLTAAKSQVTSLTTSLGTINDSIGWR